MRDKVSSLSVDSVTADLQAKVREQVRQELLRHGASDALNDPVVFASLDALLHRATRAVPAGTQLMPEFLGDPATWRLETALAYRSHRGGAVASAFIFVKARLLMPLFRWLFEYSRDNFERQRKVNDVLFACVQELAIENARLRRDLDRLTPP